MLTGTKIIHVYVYILPSTTSCPLQDEDFCGFVTKNLIVALLLSFVSPIFFFLHRLHICFEVTVKLH